MGNFIVITGASSGIGKAIFETLYESREKGESFILLDKQPVVEEEKVSVERACVDLATDEGLLESKSRIALSLAREGGFIKVLVNNAGIMPLIDFHMTEFGDYDVVMNTNARAVFFLCQYCLPYMMLDGRIINVSSISGCVPESRTDIFPYAMSKAAIVILSRYLALCYPKVRVNAISLGFVEDTNIVPGSPRVPEELLANVPLKRAASPCEIARTVQFLVSPAADYVTGHNFVIDGGASL